MNIPRREIALSSLTGANQSWASVRDRLTGLTSRRHFVEHLEWLLAQAARPARIAVCVIDIDQFKMINERYGHELGDRLLFDLASRLRQLTGRGRKLARLGRDRFALLAEGTAAGAEAADWAAQVISRMAEPFHVDGHAIRLAASAGVVERASAGATATDLLGAADSALRWAKADGGARCCVYTEDRARRDRARRDLAAAIDSGQIVLHYQPLVDLRFPAAVDQRPPRILGFEALARWQHPERGLVHPSEFIPLAHESGLITELGTRLLRAACHQAASWSAAGSARPYVSVNVAAEQLTAPGFVDVVTGALDDARLAPEQLHLEITEHSVIETGERLRFTLRALHRHGVRLVLDDFGTGYSNLTVLPQLPLYGLKLDCGFARTTGDDSTRAFLKQVVSIGPALGLSVTAEGVETREQALLMRKLGCQVGQGWLFGRPVPAEKTYQLIWGAAGPRRTGWAHRPLPSGADVVRHVG